MREVGEAAPRAPWTVPIAQSPVRPWLDRGIAAVFAIGGSLLIGAMARITPDPRGHGTHEQLGIARCGWPLQYGIPCPTCGCTTAACQLVHGDVLQAFVTQPFGAAVAAFGVLATVHATLCLLRGRSFVDLMVRLPFWRFVSGGVVLLLVSWAYKYWTWPV